MKNKPKFPQKCLPIYRGFDTTWNSWVHYLGYGSDADEQVIQDNSKDVSILEKITEVDEDMHISKTHVIWREQA